MPDQPPFGAIPPTPIKLPGEDAPDTGRPAPTGTNVGQPAPGASSNPTPLMRYRAINQVVKDLKVQLAQFETAFANAEQARQKMEATFQTLEQLAPDLPLA